MTKSKKSIKFKSFFGFALNTANSGEEVGVGFQFNVDDKFSTEAKLTMTQHALDDFVYPEIMRRIAKKQLDPNFRLQKAHILFYSIYSKNDVLLNDNVRIDAIMQLEKGKSFKSGESVMESDCKDILGLYPSKKNDPNAAHILLVKFKNKWYFAADLIYDREKVRKKFVSSHEFLKSVENNLEKQLWEPFIDNLFSVTELTIQSILLLRHYNEYSRRQSHKKTREIFEGYCKQGNLPMTFLEHYDTLLELRKKGRYQQGVHGKKFSIKKTDAKKYVTLTKQLIAYVESLLKTVDKNRNLKPMDFVS